jgi:hypothetical protein
MDHVFLTAPQKKALSDDFLFDVLCEQTQKMFPSPEEGSYFSDEEEQSFLDFVDAGKRNPNAAGTGRWKLTKKRNKILFMFIGKTILDLDKTMINLKEYIQSFMNMDVDFKNLGDCYNLCDKKISIENQEYGFITFGAPRKGGKKKRRKLITEIHENAVDVFSLFDILVDLAKEPYASVLCCIDCLLFERDDDTGEAHEVMGRACGDRVACVSMHESTYRGDENLKGFLSTSIHELLHTMGFDHCNSWKCVMNAIAPTDEEDNCLFLSPVNLRKFKLLHKIGDEDTSFLLDRYKRILNTALIQTHPSFVLEKKWLSKIVALLSDRCLL